MNIDELKLPPHNITAEHSVLGGLLLENNAYDKVVDILSAEDFYHHDHRRIYAHISQLVEQGKPADVVLVAESLEAANELDTVGGIAYLGDLANAVPSTANIKRYAQIVREKAVLRGLQGVANAIFEACQSQGATDPGKIAHDAEEAISALVNRQSSEPQSVAEVFSEALRYVDERGERGRDTAGLATGFVDFDRMTGGLDPGQLAVVAARPAVGKTIFGCNVANHVASQGGSALFFTLEMTSREIGMRILSARTRVSVHEMKTGTRDTGHWDRFSDQLAASGAERLFIDDRPAIGVPYIRAKARTIQRKNGLDLIVVDYLQLMRGQGENRTQEIGSISRGLKALAKELRVPIIALAQLNRGVESRHDKRPMMSDLRDSGEVEQDADIVVMLHREELYSDNPQWIGYAELLIRKNRNGPTGDLALGYFPEQMKFANYTGPNVRRLAEQAARHENKPRRGFGGD